MSDVLERLLAEQGDLATDASAEILRLRSHVAVLEAELATTTGTLARLRREAFEPPAFRIDHDQPSTTPKE